MHERRAIAAAMATVIAVTLPVFLVGALGPQLRADLGFGRSALGAAIAICQATSAASAWSLGRRVIAQGPARAVRISALLSATALVGIAVVARDWIVLALFLVGCGLANAVGQPATNALLATEVGVHRRGGAFGVKMAAVPLSTLLVGVLIPVVAVPLGWRWAVGLMVVIPAAALLLIGPSASRRPSALADLPPPNTSRSALVLLAAGVGLTIAATNSVPSFYVDAAVESGLAESTAGLFLAAGGLAGVTARLLIGRVVDRRASVRVEVVVAMMVTGASGYALLAASSPLLQLTGVVIVFALGWGWVGLFIYLVVAVNPANPGSATGITDTGGYVGAALGPLTTGVIADRASFGVAWLTAGAAATIGAILVVAGSRVARRQGAPVELRSTGAVAERRSVD